jgi:hypothetical protein
MCGNINKKDQEGQFPQPPLVSTETSFNLCSEKQA